MLHNIITKSGEEWILNTKDERHHGRPTLTAPNGSLFILDGPAVHAFAGAFHGASAEFLGTDEPTGLIARLRDAWRRQYEARALERKRRNGE